MKAISILGIHKDIDLDYAKSMVILHENEAYSYFDEGLTRYVYVNDDRTKVVKINKSSRGINHNELELEIYKKAGDLTKLDMVTTTMVGELIVQDYVTPIKYGGKKLTMEQVRFAASCRNEVGWTREGNLQCFDLDEYKKY